MHGDVDNNCKRCGEGVDYSSPHAEIVRREFREVPRPSTVEYLCESCLDQYERQFLEKG